MYRNLTASYGAASAAVCRAILLALSLNLTMHARSQVTGSEWRAPRGTPFECWSLAHTNWPAIPGPNCDDCLVYSLGTNTQGVAGYLVDDVDYWQARESQSLASASSQEMQGGEPDGPLGPVYGPDDLWIELIQMDLTNQLAFLRLHGTVGGEFYQLLSTNRLGQSGQSGEWKLGEIAAGVPGTNQTDFEPVPTDGNTAMFFRAHYSDNRVSVFPGVPPNDSAIEPTNSTSGQDGSFRIFSSSPSNLTVYYRLSGTAEKGVYYTNLSGIVTVPAGPGFADVIIHPIQDDLIEFDECVILTLAQTNTYLINPAHQAATIVIHDNFPTNIFVPVVAGLDTPSCIDYHQPSNSLIVAEGGLGTPRNNFLRIDTNGAVTGWTGITQAVDEVKMAIVKQTASGFTNGQIYFTGPSTASVGQISSNGASWNTGWLFLPSEFFSVQGGFYVDQTGVFSNNLIVVSGATPSEGANVWQVDAAGNATNFASLEHLHCEGVITLTNDSQRWGPWAGKILTGAESEFDGTTNLFAVDTNGVVARFDLGISAEDFDVIPPNQDLYCVDEHDGLVLKVSQTLLTNYVGDLLITQGGRAAPPPELFIVHWDGLRFVCRGIEVPYYSKGTFTTNDNELESCVFAPMRIPPLP